MKFNTFVEDPEDPNRYYYLTGGVTDKSILGFRKFVKKFAPAKDGWQFFSVDLLWDHPVTYTYRKKQEVSQYTNLVMFTFVRNMGLDRVQFVTDGFGWGYYGTGPTGLFNAVNEVFEIPLPMMETFRKWICTRESGRDHLIMVDEIRDVVQAKV